MTRQTVLVTGGAGFIGSHLAAACRTRWNVRVLDDLSSGRIGNLSGLDVARKVLILARDVLASQYSLHTNPRLDDGFYPPIGQGTIDGSTVVPLPAGGTLEPCSPSTPVT